jgi:tyrosinase
MNNGSLLPSSLVVTDLATALSKSTYGSFCLALDNTPHGPVHTLVGGGGNFSRISTSARDPLFWLHHCNVDRQWNIWLNQPQRSNPSDSLFLNEPFTFVNESGQTITGQRGRSWIQNC